MEKMIAKLQAVKTSQLKEMVIALASDLSTEATIVTDAVLSVLMDRMPEDEFVEFCEAM